MVFRFVLRLGPKDIEAGQVRIWHAEIPVKRSNVALDELEAEDCRADGDDPEGYAGKSKKAHRESHTYVANNMEEMGNIVE